MPICSFAGIENTIVDPSSSRETKCFVCIRRRVVGAWCSRSVSELSAVFALRILSRCLRCRSRPCSLCASFLSSSVAYFGPLLRIAMVTGRITELRAGVCWSGENNERAITRGQEKGGGETAQLLFLLVLCTELPILSLDICFLC